MNASPFLLFTFLTLAMLSGSPTGSAGAAPPAASPDLDGLPSPAACEDFAERQIGLANRQIRRDNYAAALRVLQTAAENCDISRVRSKIEDTLSRWYQSMGTPSTGEAARFLQTIGQQSHLPNGARARLRSMVAGDVRSIVSSSFDAGDYGRAATYCGQFPSFTDGSFERQYKCGESARKIQSYGPAATRYRWLLDNWSTDQNDVTWDEAARRLTSLYLVQTNFDDAFDLSKRLATRDPQPETIMTAVMAVRGRMLEPIAHLGRTLLDGVTATRSMSYVKTGFPRIRFPSYVESVYTVTGDLDADVAFYGADDARLPSATRVESAAGNVSLLMSNNADRAWLIAPIDTGYLLVQYSRDTVAEENVILESVLSNIQDETEWKALYDYEFTSTYPATGSAVATLLGGAYLAGDTIASFNDGVDRLSALAFYAVQNQDGTIVASHAFQQAQIDYTDEEWSKTSKTPALYHHEVTKNGTPLREVVWPLYDDKRWTGVVRVGITSEN